MLRNLKANIYPSTTNYYYYIQSQETWNPGNKFTHYGKFDDGQPTTHVFAPGEDLEETLEQPWRCEGDMLTSKLW